MRFEDLPIQFACTAVNIENGELTVFTQGDILPAVKASMAMPGVFKPVKIDGKKIYRWWNLGNSSNKNN